MADGTIFDQTQESALTAAHRLKVLIVQGVIAATPAQARTAIENKIATGEVD